MFNAYFLFVVNGVNMLHILIDSDLALLLVERYAFFVDQLAEVGRARLEVTLDAGH